MQTYFKRKFHFRTVAYSQENGDTKYILLDLDGTLLWNVPIAKIPGNLRKSKDVPPMQKLLAYALEPARYLLMKGRDRPVSKAVIKFLNAICRNIPYKDFRASPEDIEVNEPVIDFLKELEKDGTRYKFLVLSHTPTKLIEEYMKEMNPDFDYEIKGIELNIKDGRVYGFDYKDPFTTVMLTEGGKAAKNYYAAKLLSEGYEIAGAIGNTFPEDFPMKDCVQDQFLKHFVGENGEYLGILGDYKEAPVWGLHTPVKGNWRLYSKLYDPPEYGKRVSPKRPDRIAELIEDGKSQQYIEFATISQ